MLEQQGIEGEDELVEGVVQWEGGGASGGGRGSGSVAEQPNREQLRHWSQSRHCQLSTDHQQLNTTQPSWHHCHQWRTIHLQQLY